MSIEKEKLESVRQQVRESNLKETHKDALDDMLRLTADATNGTTDRLQAIAVGQAAIALCFARDAIYRQTDFADMIANHQANCKHVHDGIDGRDGRDGLRGRDSIAITGKLGRVTFPQAISWAVVILVAYLGTMWCVAKAKGWL